MQSLREKSAAPDKGAFAEMVIETIERCLGSGCYCDNCPYHAGMCIYGVMRDAATLLRAAEEKRGVVK